MQAVGTLNAGGEGEVKLASKRIAEVLSASRKTWRQARKLHEALDASLKCHLRPHLRPNTAFYRISDDLKMFGGGQ